MRATPNVPTELPRREKGIGPPPEIWLEDRDRGHSRWGKARGHRTPPAVNGFNTGIGGAQVCGGGALAFGDSRDTLTRESSGAATANLGEPTRPHGFEENRQQTERDTRAAGAKSGLGIPFSTARGG
jgi:hypothetical protein